jgi:nitroreductase
MTINLSVDALQTAVAEARLAPSVHNTQPSRWHLDETSGTISLLGDTRCALPAADPTRRDWLISHGASLEGMALALGARGLTVAELVLTTPTNGEVVPVAQFTVRAGPAIHPQSALVMRRVSWRGPFQVATVETDTSLDLLAASHDDLILVRSRSAIDGVAHLADRASLVFLRDPAHRRELSAWMRLSPTDPRYLRDGLNAEALAMGGLEAKATGLVLGPLFAALDRLGLAAPLVADARKTRTAAAIAVFHRPTTEHPLLTGRAFYQVWLAMEHAGLQGCPLSVLADWPDARAALANQFGIGPDRQIISAFRIGKPLGQPHTGHARLPVDALIIR